MPGNYQDVCLTDYSRIEVGFNLPTNDVPPEAYGFGIWIPTARRNYAIEPDDLCMFDNTTATKSSAPGLAAALGSGGFKPERTKLKYSSQGRLVTRVRIEFARDAYSTEEKSLMLFAKLILFPWTEIKVWRHFYDDSAEPWLNLLFGVSS